MIYYDGIQMGEEPMKEIEMSIYDDFIEPRRINDGNNLYTLSEYVGEEINIERVSLYNFDSLMPFMARKLNMAVDQMQECIECVFECIYDSDGDSGTLEFTGEESFDDTLYEYFMDMITDYHISFDIFMRIKDVIIHVFDNEEKIKECLIVGWEYEDNLNLIVDES